ncbi:MAG: N-glycosylase/DNA lyase [archaeon]|nr:N-glycosylase/DNA lyase [archaeon]
MQEKELLEKICGLQKSSIAPIVEQRYLEFQSFKGRAEEDWFCELCFCLLTANTSSEMGSRVQSALGFEGFYNLPPKKLVAELKKAGSRFYNRRAQFIVDARRHFGLKEKISEFENDREAREYLAKNVKGLGFKESSHFLRNTGSDNVAILDKHVVNLISEFGLLVERPKSVNARNYCAIESRLDLFAKKTGLSHSKLDLYLWYMKTGKVLK